MIVSLLACLALGQTPEPAGDFEGTWELVALSVSGLPRPGEGLLRISPAAGGEERWTWSAIHIMQAPYRVHRRAGSPWPEITASFDEGPVGGHVSPRRGVYRLKGDSLTIAFNASGALTGPGDSAFRPAAKRTVETYRRVARAADAAYRPRPFPTKAGRVLAEWDEALRGGLQNPPRGVLNGMQLRDYGDGILIAVRARSEFLDDPPAPDLRPEDLPSGTLVRPAGGRFDPKADRVVDPAPTPDQKAFIDAFRDQDPNVPDRHVHHASVYPPNPFPPDVQLLGWDGVLAATKAEPDRLVATVVFRPRVLGKGAHGRNLLYYAPLLIETWELRGGRLSYLAGGPDLTDFGLRDRHPFAPQRGVRP